MRDEAHDQGVTLEKLLMAAERSEELLREILKAVSRRGTDVFTLHGSRGVMVPLEEGAPRGGDGDCAGDRGGPRARGLREGP